MVASCPACGRGPWEAQEQSPAPPAGEVASLQARCRHCGVSRQLRFVLDHDCTPGTPEPLAINPTSQPSRIIDLGQWLALYYLFADSAARQEEPRGRLAQLRAALCIEEALKFYGDDELPPASAFFTAANRESFRQHPAGYARQKLRDMRSRLPATTAAPAPSDRPGPAAPRRRWRFWRRKEG